MENADSRSQLWETTQLAARGIETPELAREGEGEGPALASRP
jgi:hypothetical protein